MHVSCDIGLGLQFDILSSMHRSDYRAIDDGMRHPYLSLNLGLFAQNQGARLVIRGGHIAADTPIHPQASAERDVAFDGGAGADKAVNAILRLAGFGPEHIGTPLTTGLWFASIPASDCRFPTRAPGPF